MIVFRDFLPLSSIIVLGNKKKKKIPFYFIGICFVCTLLALRDIKMYYSPFE